jgi:16S rRNA (cytidine1402-2'-O)-methyltransferase
MKKGNLYLIPTLLGDGAYDDVLPANLRQIIVKITYFVVEDLRTARRFLKKADPSIDINKLSFELLNEHSSHEDIPSLLNPLLEGNDLGIMSEAGTPCVADPGSALVSLAHSHGIRVIPISGPSSITLALMASGFNGQNFTFLGYLPVEKRERNAALRRIEQDAFRKSQTQIFIETPYRNMKMFESILESCTAGTRLCIAANLTTNDEMIKTLSVAEWKKQTPAIHKQPAVFLIYK